MENLDPASVEAQRHVISEIFRSVHHEPVTLGALLQAYDHTLAKHGICASDLAGIQIYRALLQWGRERGNATPGRGRQRARAAVDSALQPLQYAPAWEPNKQSATADAQPASGTAVREGSVVIGGVPPVRSSSPATDVCRPASHADIVTPALGSTATPGDALKYESKLGQKDGVPDELAPIGGLQSHLSAQSPQALPAASRIRSGSPTPFPAYLHAGLQDGIVYGAARHREHPSAPIVQNLRYGRSSSPAAPESTPSFLDWSPLVAPAAAPRLPEHATANGLSSSRSPRRSSARSSSPTPGFGDLAATYQGMSEDQCQDAGQLAIPSSTYADLEARLLGPLRGAWQDTGRDERLSPRGFAPPLDLTDAAVWPTGSQRLDWQSNPYRRPPAAPAQSSMSPYTIPPSGPPAVSPPARDPSWPVDEASWRLPAKSDLVPPVAVTSQSTDEVLAEADMVLSEAFAYRRILRSVIIKWKRGAHLCRVARRVASVQAAALLSCIFRLWSEACCSAARQREHALRSAAAWSCRRNATTKKQTVCMWRLACCKMVELRRQHSAVRSLLAGCRLRQWFEVYQDATAHAVYVQRTMLIEWRAVVRQCRKLRVILAEQELEKAFQKRADGFYWWQNFCRRWRAERQLMQEGATLGRRIRLSRAVLRWHDGVQQRRVRDQWLTGAIALARSQVRRAAINDWHGLVAPHKQRKRLAGLLRDQRRKRILRSGLASWHDRLAAFPRKSNRLLRSLGKVLINQRLRVMCATWCGAVQQERAKQDSADRMRRLHLLQAGLRTFESHALERRLLGTYKAWADLLWVRSLLRRGWSAWYSWLITSGRVTMMSNEAQILAAWRWLRVSAACGGPSSGVAQPFRDPQLHRGEAVSLCMHRYGESAMQCGAMQTISAVDMFFCCAPFMVHPHRFHSWKWSLLAIFVQALLRQVLHRWFEDTRLHRIFGIRLRRTFCHRIFHSWWRVSRRRKTCRANSEHVGHRLILMRRRWLVCRWAKSSRVQATLRRGAHQFAFASRERLCRRALLAWREAKAWRDHIFASGQAVVTRYLLGLERDAFNAMLSYWQHARQSTLLVRLSGLFLRKRSLRDGIDRLRVNVFRQRSSRLDANARLQKLQRTWLQRWWCQHQRRNDLQRRDAAALGWSKSKLLATVCSAWLSWARVAATQRRQVAAHRHCRVLRAAAGHLRDWRWRTDCRFARRCAASTLRRHLAFRRRTQVLRWWRRSTVETLAWKLSTRVAESQLLGEVIGAWKQQAAQSRAIDVCCIGTIVLQRFRVFIAVWHREVVLSQLVRHFFKQRSQCNLRAGLAVMREHVGHCRRTCKVKDVARARRQSRLLAECHRGWVAHVRQCICWRACVEAMQDAAQGRLVSSCLCEWRVCVERQQDLRIRAELAERAVRAQRASSTLRVIWQHFRVARGFRSATGHMTFSILSDCLRGWQQVARCRTRCHQATIMLSQALRTHRCGTAWQHWHARFAARQQFRQGLALFREAIIARRLQSFVTAWQDALAEARILQARLANARELANVILLRRSLRGLALWCVHCSERNEALERMVCGLRSSGLRAGISWWSSGVASMRDLELRVVASVSLQNLQSQRLSFDSWVRVWLLQKQMRSLAAMARHFRERRLAAKLWLAWLGVVCRELALRSCETMARGRSLERCKFGAWHKWRRHMAELWLRQEQARQVQERLRDLAVRRTLLRWHSRLAHLQHLKDAVATIVQRRGLQNTLQPAVVLSALVGSARSPTDLLQALAEASLAQRTCQAWRALVHARHLRAQEVVQLLMEATVRRETSQCARCFAAIAALSMVLLERRREISARFLHQRLEKCFRGWARAISTKRQALIEFRQRRWQLVGVTLRTMLHCWVGYHLSRRSLQLLSGELQERCQRRRAKGGLLRWLRVSTVGHKARQSGNRRRLRTMSLVVVGWRRHRFQCARVAELLRRTAQTILHPALHSWRHAALQRRSDHTVVNRTLRIWQACVAGCRARRSCIEVLRNVRATRLRQQALSHWSLRLSKMLPGSVVLNPCHVAVRQFWGRWRRRTLEGNAKHQRELAAGQYLRRSRAAWGLSTWRHRLLKSRAALEQKISVETWARRSQLLSGWQRWRTRALAKRSLSSRGHVLATRVALACLSRCWLAWRRWTALQIRILVFSSSWQRSTVLQRFQAWKKATLVSQAGAILRMQLATREQARRFRAWRRATAASHLFAMLASSEARFHRNAMSAGFRQLSRQHVAFQASVSEFAAKHPAVVERLRELLEASREDRRETLLAWHLWARSQQHIMARQRSLCQLLAKRSRSDALHTWGAFRVNSGLRRQHEALSAQARRASTDKLRRTALGSWRATAAGTKRRRFISAQAHRASMDRLRRTALGSWRATAASTRRRRFISAQAHRAFMDRQRRTALGSWRATAAGTRRRRFSAKLADSMHHRWTQRTAWLQWLHLASVGAEVRAAAHQAGEALVVQLARNILHLWRERCRWAAAMRLATMRFSALQVRRRVIQALGAWRATARQLAALATMHELQADDLWRKQRKALGAVVAAAWRQEVERIRLAASQARAAKVLACWRLYTQEQVLLRRYLGQCSMANFRGDTSESASSVPGAVQPADFERLYEQMAAHRWDLTDVMSD